MTQTTQNNTTEVFDDQIQALAKHLNLDNEDLSMIEENGDHYKFGEQEYLVVTDDEAEQLWDEHLDHYIEDCILPEMPEHFRSYFDEDKWKQDARMDGRAHSLALYDGDENYIEINGIEYYIYRTN
ncbi:hypothetical protein Lederberg_29 [Pelagibacter phage Lederberg EXVC029P]|nr:hypothetical protein Lederberg_29 [Pelagibacter phage Lederberg EXVC029P]